MATGNKWLVETDTPSGESLRFVRTYNSNPGTVTDALGSNWRSEYRQHLGFDSATGSVWAYRPDGRAIKYTVSGGSYVADADIPDRLYPEATVGYRLETANHRIERFDLAGRLVSLTDVRGQTQTLAYDAQNRLSTVTDQNGRTLSFVYDTNGRLTTLINPAGRQITYTYDAASNLSTVTYPDLKTKTYYYNEAAQTGGANLPHALTGIRDENGVRYISYAYDASGRAIDEVNPAVGVNTNRYQLAYNTNSTTVTDPLGSSRTYNFQTILGISRNIGSSQPGGSGCGPSASAITYDANGSIASLTGFSGTVTNYTYDLARNLETQRVEANGSSVARTISTQWHSVWRLPTKVAEPKKLTSYIYNGDLDNGQPVACAPVDAVIPVAAGNQPIAVLCAQVEQATTDPDGGQGLAATPDASISARLSSFTYDAQGRVLTAKDSLNATTSYAYYGATAFTGTAPNEVGHTVGDLYTITDPKGFVTTFNAYDKAGRILQMTDPKGIVTAMTYTPRGWISTVSVTPPGGTARVTTYTYDFVGQVTGVSNPDGTTIGYTYDAAHRLIGATDAKGNSVNYTLDNMGNRIAEQLKDPGGVLQRTMSRSFDALNRVQQLQLQ